MQRPAWYRYEYAVHAAYGRIETEILALLEQVRSDVRCISHELMPPKFQVTTLAETVKAYVEGLALPASVQLAFSKENEEIQWSQVPEEVSYEVYRIMQELLSIS